MRKIIYQNYNWMFKENYEEQDLAINNFNGFEIVNIPHTNKQLPLNNFDETLSHIVSTYKKVINIKLENKKYFLVFEGVGHYSKLYVNGVFVKEHKCGYTRFEIDITSFIKDGDNEITLVVDSREIDQPPFGFVIDYLCFGGIYRDCYLKVTSNDYIEDYYFNHDEKSYNLDYKINSDKNLLVRLTITDKNQNVIIDKTINNNDRLSDFLPNVILWDIDNPYLYNLKVQLFDSNNNLLDEINDKIGFRTIDFKEDGFYLNNKKIKLRGLNRHQSYPYVGYAMPFRGQEEDAIMLKETLCLNAVRTSHYPQSIDFLNKCDELGLLVFEEIPGWQNVGNEKWQEIAINNVKDMINRDKNHPSIILWGVRINESGDYHDFYSKTNAIAHKLDPYRKTGGVRCFAHSELLEDVYTYNDFVCTGKDIALREKEEITTSDKPYLVSEYGGHMFPTKSFDNENRRTDLSLIHASILKKSVLDDKIAGTFGWCFADYNTHKDFGSGDLICYHGVCDIFRNIKYSAFPYMTYNNKPFLEITSNFNIGESNGGYIRKFAIMTNCDEVKMYHNNQLINTYHINDFKVDGCFEVDDLIGNLLIENDNLSEKESAEVKEIVKEILSYDGIIRKETTDKYGKEKTSIAWNYYGKYVSNWGSKATPYHFEGYKNNELVIQIDKGFQHIKDIKVSVSTDTLITNRSYDVCKITLEAIGNLNNRVDYAFDAFKIEVNENLEVIGDDIVSLIGGVRSFYVKSKVKNGKGVINILSSRFKINPIEINIQENEKPIEK